VWRRYPVEGYYDTRWLTGLCSTQAKEEGIMLKAAWYWCSDSSVLNDLGKPDLLSTRGSMDSDHMFSPRISLEGSLTGDSDRYE